jgi:UDP-N-acetylmuramoyl-L-alanyl-D-glutamate--2,6-diaminopimelate ligase
MLVRDFLKIDGIEKVKGDLDQEVSGLSYDSRKVLPGEIFFAAAGEKTDGHEFIFEAVKRGAAAVVFSRAGDWPAAAAAVRVKDVRRSMGLWAAHFYGRPSEKIRLVGVTGTNGKTTLTYLVESILAAAAIKSGVIGTINYRYGGRELPSHHTTPEAPDLHALIDEMLRAGVEVVAMEVSSHALAQERVRGLDFDVGVFTNLSRDHLDYHRDMDEYFSAKAKLFTDHLQASRKPRKAAVIYGEDARGRQLIEQLRCSGFDLWAYGDGQEWDVHPLDVKQDIGGLRGAMQVRESILEIDSQLVGAANLQNIMGAVAVGRALGIETDVIARGISQLNSVPGRLEKIANDRGIAILVDYAHSPDALAKVLGAIRSVVHGRVVCVFGCGGDRDRGKRPLMGELAARLSDFVVLTSDNPRTEDPLAILGEVEAGVKKAGLKKLEGAGLASRGRESGFERGYVVEADRRRAIGIGIEAASAGDAVLIAGKGHEDYQILGISKIHFDDREVARQVLGRQASA